MNESTRLNEMKASTSQFYQQARSHPSSPPELDLAWNAAREAIRLAHGTEEEMDVVLRWKSVFFEFAHLSHDERHVFAVPLWSEARLREKRRAILDLRPAIAKFMAEHDLILERHHAQREALALAARAAEAAKEQQARRAAALACWRRLASSGLTLTLNKAGGVQAAPSALLDPADLSELMSHGAELVELLRQPAVQVAA